VPQTLLEPEFDEPYQAWKSKPTPETASAFLTAVRPVLDTAVRTYAGEKAGPTAMSKAKQLALDAATKYDPSQAKLRTHLMIRLQPLRRAGLTASQPIVLPERVALDMGRLRTAESEFTERYGRDPSTSELADATGISTRRLAKLRGFKPAAAEGAMSRGVGNELYSPAVKSDDNDDVWATFVHGDLSPTDQLIMEHTLGLFGRAKLSKQALAARLGLSAGAVSQRAARIQARLDSKDELAAGLV